MKLVLFDCDGTLVDSAHLIHEVMVRTFRHFELDEPEAAATHSIIGLTLDSAIARMRGLDVVDAQATAMMAHYKSIFAATRLEAGFQEPLFPGIAGVMAELSRQDDLILGAVTGKSRRGLSMVCETHGWTETFFVTRTADDCPSKPHPAMVLECCDTTGISPTDTIVIGDSIYDMEMARAAGAHALGVSWGYGAIDDLRRAGADRIAEAATDIPLLIRQFRP
ncbi:HAD-IA family hydrolase [Rhizobium sp. C1]|uniref:HAD-IA family hydrolase n=1 Tax=Rhizobium sp. C1 TaxID=1349799 RepID=UPI001E4724FB|nr:HAD-IA family hydrolase [Rhizobium sp. C1]MCD2176962.1 HAD-IA family hydrolase [Rhizobium sp. C1]